MAIKWQLVISPFVKERTLARRLVPVQMGCTQCGAFRGASGKLFQFGTTQDDGSVKPHPGHYDKKECHDTYMNRLGLNTVGEPLVPTEVTHG